MNNQAKLNTDNLIKKMAGQGAMPAGYLWRNVFYASWLFCCMTVVFLLLLVVPIRANLSYLIFHAPYFWTETFLSSFLCLILLYLTYLSALPGRLKNNFYWPAVALAVSLIAAILYRFNFVEARTELSQLGFFLPRCGLIILPIGFVTALAMFFVLRKAAPTRLKTTSALMALTAGTFNICLMQMICKYDSSVHLLVWHILPVALLSVIMIPVGQRLLRW